MSDFKFTDDDSPPSSSPPPAAPKGEDLPAKPSEFHLEGEKKPVPVIPTPVIPSPQIPIGPAPPVMNPPAGAPGGPAKPLQPRPSPAHAQAQSQSQQAQAAGGQRPGNKPIPIPMPTIPLPIETVEGRAGSDREGAPQDDFSFKIWSVGESIRKGFDMLEGPASWVLRVGLVIGITALAYILAGTLLGKAGDLSGNPNAAALVKNLTLSTQAFMICLLLVGVSTLILGYEDNRLGFAVGAVGVLCHFVIPVVLKKFVGDSAATAAMAPIFRHYGYFLVMIGLVKGLFDTAVWLWNLPEAIKEKYASVGVANQAETKQRIIAREANMLSPCWRLPFCRESIRKQCPAFLAKSTCWKFGRGCYCDEEMISRIVRGEALDAIKAPTRQSRQGKAPCGRCYIYLEHQTYKFRVLSPLALPVSVLSTWLIWPFYVKVFAVANGALDSIWNTM
ncbi:hypothetical protein EON80_19450, partial [bacterium]